MREIGRAGHASTEQLSALLDDRAEPEDQAFLAEHVEDCPTCSHELADLRSVQALLRALPVYLPPRSFTIPVEAPRPAPRFRRLIPLTRALSAIAAVLCVVLFTADAMQLGDRADAPVPDGGAAFQITAARATFPPAKPALSAAESAKPAETASAAESAPAAAAARPAEALKPAPAARPADEAKPAAPAAAPPVDAAKSAFAPAATQAPSTVQTPGAVRTIPPTPPAPTSGQPAQAARSAPAPAAPAQSADTASRPSAPGAAADAAPAPPPAPPGAPPQPASAAQAPAPQAPGTAAGAAAQAPAAQGAQAAPTAPSAPATATVPAVIRGEPGQALEGPGAATSRTTPWLSPIRLWALGLAIASAALLIGSVVLSRLARSSAQAGGARSHR